MKLHFVFTLLFGRRCYFSVCHKLPLFRCVTIRNKRKNVSVRDILVIFVNTVIHLQLMLENWQKKKRNCFIITYTHLVYHSVMYSICLLAIAVAVTVPRNYGFFTINYVKCCLVIILHFISFIEWC